MAYDRAADGSVSNGRVFADASASTEKGAMDSMDVDSGGNLYATGPGGIWVISPAGTHLGTIKLPEATSSVAFGDDDGRTLYITATSSVYKLRVKVPGQRVIYN
jgi:gluconolactonase